MTAVNVKDFAIVQPGEVLFQIDDRIYKQRVHQAQATLAMKEAALRNNLQQRKKRRGYITAVNVKDFAIVQPGEVLFQIDDRIYK
ncbi:biotin/lipoyl-binding protein, partial [Escherichia coli]|uniref:biotin/lipoyl-binding protein n=1 Tax=Escherichia coli TaxID=562 RepID=UPI003D9A6BE3